MDINHLIEKGAALADLNKEYVSSLARVAALADGLAKAYADVAEHMGQSPDTVITVANAETCLLARCCRNAAQVREGFMSPEASASDVAALAALVKKVKGAAKALNPANQEHNLLLMKVQDETSKLAEEYLKLGQ